MKSKITSEKLKIQRTYAIELTDEELYLIRSAFCEANSLWSDRRREAREATSVAQVSQYNIDVCSDIINEYDEMLDKLDQIED